MEDDLVHAIQCVVERHFVLFGQPLSDPLGRRAAVAQSPDTRGRLIQPEGTPAPRVDKERVAVERLFDNVTAPSRCDDGHMPGRPAGLVHGTSCS